MDIKVDSFEIGKIVYHKTNSEQKLLVVYISDKNDITCEWIDKNGVFQNETFSNGEGLITQIISRPRKIIPSPPSRH